ncbi:ead/Ea22-like family protein [Klebsiella pneumoniae]
MTDITELAQSLKAAAEKATPGPWGVARDGKTLVSNQSHPIATVSDAMHRMLADGSTGKDAEFIALANPANIRALVDALEKAQTINAAAEKLVRCKGRYHSEQNYRALAALFGVTTPDLPPLEHENVHYADAAEIEIAALRQRIAELESRTVKLPKPHAHLIWIQAGHAPDDYWDDVAVSHSDKDRCCDGSERYPVYARWEIEEILAAAGIKVEAE